MENPALLFATLFVAAFFAGGINSVAGGGTLLTFPALVAALTPLYGTTAEAIECADECGVVTSAG